MTSAQSVGRKKVGIEHKQEKDQRVCEEGPESEKDWPGRGPRH